VTQNENIKKDYYERINRVLNFVQQNLDQSFDLKQLAALGNFSSFHFHRIFKAYLGEPIGAYVKRLRLEKSVQFLFFTNDSISKIAFEVGYETSSAFSSAFSQHFGVSPSAFRKTKQPANKKIDMHTPSKNNFDLEPIIKLVPITNVAFIRVFGNYDADKIGPAWDQLFQFASKNDLFNPQMQLFGISYGNPEIAKEETIEYNACISINKKLDSDGEISVKQLSGGKYAVFTYKGSYEKFNTVYDLIFKEWLLKSDYELRDSEIFDKYLNSHKDTPPENLITEIHIPIK